MTLDGLRVNHGALNAAADNMYTLVKAMDQTLNDLENDLAPLVATWSGNQQESYRVSKAAWDWAMKEMRDLLDESKASVYTSNQEYMQADKRGAQRFEF